MLLMLLGGLMVSGCLETTAPPAWLPKILTMSQPMGEEEIFVLPDGDKISFEQLMEDLNSTTIIFVGETHDRPEHHRIQVKIIQRLLKERKDVVVAMEMFERSQQSILDSWSQGLLAEEEFLRKLKWETTWGMDYDLYKGILDEVRVHHLKLLALNTERDLVRRVAQHGINGLTDEDNMKLPEMDLTDQQHRHYMASMYKNHQDGSATNFEYFYQAQCLWDEAMAETLSQFLQSPEETGKVVLIFVGSGHVVFDFGIPKRFYRRASILYKTIVLKEWEKDMSQDLYVTGTSSPVANFLWITKPTPPEKRRSRMGVVLKEKEDSKGLWIERVIPESPAEKAGLLPGDQFIAVEGEEITKVKDIHDALSQKGWRKDITITILREGLKKEIILTLPPARD